MLQIVQVFDRKNIENGKSKQFMLWVTSWLFSDQSSHVDLWALIGLYRTFCVGSEFGSHAKCELARPNLTAVASAATVGAYVASATRCFPSSSSLPKP